MNQNSNEKSKCCEKCKSSRGTDCWDEDCPCHKPSVEVSKCCGSKKKVLYDISRMEKDVVCPSCGKPFEPQSIPLDERCKNCYAIPEDKEPSCFIECSCNCHLVDPTPNLTPESTECKHEMIENNMIPDTCRDCGKVLVESTEMEECEHGRYYNGNGVKIDCPVCKLYEPENTFEKILKDFNVYSMDLEVALLRKMDIRDKEISQKLVSEYKQFILNVLDGVDKADEEIGNKGGGTKAIRLAIESRII